VVIYTRFSIESRKRSPLKAPADVVACLGAQGSAQIRAATAPVQRRKWTLVRSLFVADFSDNFIQLKTTFTTMFFFSK
jgi:hypothetical protein